jgi:hypothetical protein
VDTFVKIMCVVLGWSLGLFSPPIVELIQRRYRRNQLRKSLFVELEGLRVTLAHLIYVIAGNSNSITRERIQLIEPILRSDESFPQNQEIAKYLHDVLTRTDQEIAVIMAAESPNGPLTLKKISIPFLQSQLSSLYLFSPEFQRIALKIISRLAIINEEIDVADFNYRKTFDRPPQQERAMMVVNFLQGYQNILGLCLPLIDDVNLLLSLEN